MSPIYFWCLTPVGPCGRLIAWPAGACVHRFPHGFSPGSLWGLPIRGLFLEKYLARGTSLSSSDHSCNSSTPHQLFSWLCLVYCEPEIDLRHKNDDQGNKTKGCSISASSQYCLQSDNGLFHKVGFLGPPVGFLLHLLSDVRRLERYLIK